MTDNADEPDHHGGNKGNQTTINSVSKKRKADSDIVEPDSDIESTSKKQKSASGVDDRLSLIGRTVCCYLERAKNAYTVCLRSRRERDQPPTTPRQTRQVIFTT